jgi:tol-pal system protein YbgF
MFRHSILPQAYLGLAIGVAICSMPIPVRAQDDSVTERLDRLERDLNMLQRQVYRGAPTPGSGDSGLAANDEIRLQQLDQQMRDLTGRVEEFSNQVTQLRQRLEQVNSDMEVRASGAGGAPGQLAAAVPGEPPPGSVPPGRRPMPPGDGGSVAPDGGSMPPGSVVPGPRPIFGTLSPPGTAPPGMAPPRGDPPSLLDSGRPPEAGSALPDGSPIEQYNYAFGLLKQANYPGAEAALRAFLQQHPRDPMAGSAQYWLGETFYARQKYVEAATAFADGYKRYPKGPKAAEELYKLGMALGHANQKENACVAFAQLDRAFPNAAPAIREHAAAERKRLGCG